MSEEKHADEELAFGEKLLGLQGFNAARAKRYRAELEKLLVHRITSKQRWIMGFFGITMLVTFEIVAIVFARRWEQPNLEISSETRWIFAVAIAMFGLLFGGWFLGMALRRGFSRRLGDTIGIAIVLMFGGIAACLFYTSVWTIEDKIARGQMLFGGGIVVACAVGCVVLAATQRMHRKTQEKLLRIEYHLAELMERNSESPSA